MSKFRITLSTPHLYMGGTNGSKESFSQTRKTEFLASGIISFYNIETRFSFLTTTVRKECLLHLFYYLRHIYTVYFGRLVTTGL